jgi:hypothetical protein
MALSEVGGQVMSWSRCSHVVIRSGRVGGSVSRLKPVKAILDSRVKRKLRRSRIRQASNAQRVCQKNSPSFSRVKEQQDVVAIKTHGG